MDRMINRLYTSIMDSFTFKFRKEGYKVSDNSSLENYRTEWYSDVEQILFVFTYDIENDTLLLTQRIINQSSTDDYIEICRESFNPNTITVDNHYSEQIIFEKFHQALDKTSLLRPKSKLFATSKRNVWTNLRSFEGTISGILGLIALIVLFYKIIKPEEDTLFDNPSVDFHYNTSVKNDSMYMQELLGDTVNIHSNK